MNEPKRRGRPPKAKPELIALPVACPECGQAVGHYDDCPAGMGVPLLDALSPEERAGLVNTWGEAGAESQLRSLQADGGNAKFASFHSELGEGARKIESIEVYVDPFTTKLAQAYANRVWHGQSHDAPRAWRVERVRLALEGQGLPFEGVVLP